MSEAVEKDVVFTLVVREGEGTRDALEAFGESHLDTQVGMTQAAALHAKNRVAIEVASHDRMLSSLRRFATERDRLLSAGAVSTQLPSLAPLRNPSENVPVGQLVRRPTARQTELPRRALAVPASSKGAQEASAESPKRRPALSHELPTRLPKSEPLPDGDDSVLRIAIARNAKLKRLEEELHTFRREQSALTTKTIVDDFEVQDRAAEKLFRRNQKRSQPAPASRKPEPSLSSPRSKESLVVRPKPPSSTVLHPITEPKSAGEDLPQSRRERPEENVRQVSSDVEEPILAAPKSPRRRNPTEETPPPKPTSLARPKPLVEETTPQPKVVNVLSPPKTPAVVTPSRPRSTEELPPALARSKRSKPVDRSGVSDEMIHLAEEAEKRALALAKSQSEGEKEFMHQTVAERKRVLAEMQQIQQLQAAAGQKSSALATKATIADLKQQDKEATRTEAAKVKAAEAAARKQQDLLRRVAIQRQTDRDKAVSLAASQSSDERKFADLTAQERQRVIDKVAKLERAYHAAGRKESATATKAILADLKSQDREADQIHKRHRQRQLSTARAAQQALKQEEAARKNTLASARAEHDRLTGVVATGNERMISGLQASTESAARLGRGIAMLGLIGEEDTKKILDGLVKVQAAFDIFVGGTNLVRHLSTAYKGYRTAIDATAAAQKIATVASGAAATASGVQTTALNAEAVAAGRAAAAHVTLGRSRGSGAAAGLASSAVSTTAKAGSVAAGSVAAGGTASAGLAGTVATVAAPLAAFAAAITATAAATVTAGETIRDGTKYGFMGGAKQGSFSDTIATQEVNFLSMIDKSFLRPMEQGIGKAGPGIMKAFLGGFSAPMAGIRKLTESEDRVERAKKQQQDIRRVNAEKEAQDQAKSEEQMLQSGFRSSTRNANHQLELSALDTDELVKPLRSSNEKLASQLRQQLAKIEAKDLAPFRNTTLAGQRDRQVLDVRREQRELTKQEAVPERLTAQSKQIDVQIRQETENLTAARSDMQGAVTDREKLQAQKAIEESAGRIAELTKDRLRVTREIAKSQSDANQSAIESLREQIRLVQDRIAVGKNEITDAKASFGAKSPEEQQKLLAVAKKAKDAYDKGASNVDPELLDRRNKAMKERSEAERKLASLGPISGGDISGGDISKEIAAMKDDGASREEIQARARQLRERQRRSQSPEAQEEAASLRTKITNLKRIEAGANATLGGQRVKDREDFQREAMIRGKRDKGVVLTDDEQKFEAQREERRRNAAAKALSSPEDTAIAANSGDKRLEDAAKRNYVSNADKADFDKYLGADEQQDIKRDQQIVKTLKADLKQEVKLDAKFEVDAAQQAKQLANQVQQQFATHNQELVRFFREELQGSLKQLRDDLTKDRIVRNVTLR